MFRGRQQWIKVSGWVNEIKILPGPRSPHPKLFLIEVQPEDGGSVQAEIRVTPGHQEHGYEDLYFRTDKSVTGFLFNPATGQARFDMTDPRNSRSAHSAAGMAWRHTPTDARPASMVGGPPWLVLPACRSCKKKVDQGRAAMENQPHCPSCLHLLPASPWVVIEDSH